MKLLTKELEKLFEKYPLGSQDDKGNDATVIAKFFNPCGRSTWLITEAEKQNNGDYLMYGYCCLNDPELAEFGYVSLNELESIKLPFGLSIERDLYIPENYKLGKAMEDNNLKNKQLEKEKQCHEAEM